MLHPMHPVSPFDVLLHGAAFAPQPLLCNVCSVGPCILLVLRPLQYWSA